eukprot:610988-Rhodomonas_salina.1
MSVPHSAKDTLNCYYIFTPGVEPTVGSYTPLVLVAGVRIRVGDNAEKGGGDRRRRGGRERERRGRERDRDRDRGNDTDTDTDRQTHTHTPKHQKKKKNEQIAPGGGFFAEGDEDEE